MIIGEVRKLICCWFTTDFSTADLTISMDRSRLTSPIGGLILLMMAVGLVRFVFAGLMTVLVCSRDGSIAGGWS